MTRNTSTQSTCEPIYTSEICHVSSRPQSDRLTDWLTDWLTIQICLWLRVCMHFMHKTQKLNSEQPLKPFSSPEPRSFWPAAEIESSGFVQHRKSAIHGLPVKSGKSDWLRIWNDYSAHAQKIGSDQSSRSLPQVRMIVAEGTRMLLKRTNFNLRAWTNDKRLATKHHQTLFGDQRC